MATESEKLFEMFCESRGLGYKRLVERGDQGLQTPDYLLFPDSKTPIVIEIKQLDPNDEEDQNEELLKSGEPIISRWRVGDRVRRKLSSSTTKQLKAMQTNNEPGMVVLYNNVDSSPNLLDEEEILQAMYGVVQVHVAVPEVGAAEAVGVAHGGGRRVGVETNTSLSAVGVLDKHEYRGREPELSMRIYHNMYAARSLDPTLLHAQGVKHYRKKVDATEWQSICLITQTQSAIGRLSKHKACLAGLGLRRINHTVAVDETPSNLGMARKISYMVDIH